MLTFTGEILRVTEFASGPDFPGGAQLMLGDDDTDMTVWVEASLLGQVKSFTRLQRVNVHLAARQNEYTEDRDGRVRKVKAYKVKAIGIEAASPARAAASAAAGPDSGPGAAPAVGRVNA